MRTEDRTLEQNIIAQALMSEESCAALFDDVCDDDFYHYRREVAVLRDMHNTGKPVDSVSFVQALRSRGIDTALDQLMVGADIWRYEQHYHAELRKLAKARQLQFLAQNVLNCIQSENADVDDIEGMILQKLDNLDCQDGADELITPEMQSKRMMQTLEDIIDPARRERDLIFTGAKRLDDVLGGLEAGDTVILSGYTGRGKTAFAMNLVEDIAIRQKVPTLYINTEMSQRQIDMRWMAQTSRKSSVTNSNLRNGVIADEDFGDVVNTIGEMSKSAYYLITVPDLTITKLFAKMRRYTRKYGIRVVVIDYIGRMDIEEGKGNDEWRQLLLMTKKIKIMSQKLGIVSLVISQSTEEGKLARSRAIEQECDLHLQVRELNDDESDRVDYCYNTILEIKKGRNAARAKIPCRFVGEKLKFLFDPSAAWAHYRNVAKQSQVPASTPKVAANADDDDDETDWRGRRKNGHR